MQLTDNEKDILFQKVSRSQKELQATIDSITDLIHIHDRDFTVIRANWAFARYFGLTPREVIGRRCSDLRRDKDSVLPACQDHGNADGKTPSTEELYEIKSNRTFRISTFPYSSSDGDFLGSVHIIKDITEEREREMRLIMSERLSSLGQMASGIAHEINNPLATIAGCAEGLRNRIEKDRYNPELFRNYLNIIEEEIQRCKKITTGILSLVRETTYTRKEINICEILDYTLELITFQGRMRNIRLAKRYAENIPVIHGNDGELKQVFLIIITNALDAMEDRGSLTVETSSQGNQVMIDISDSGPGISPEHMQRIFDPFFTTKSEKGGTGLGLSIANKIIASHNGSISIISEKDRGALFKISLPV